MSEYTTHIMNRMISYFDGDVRRINHALKVYAFARNIALSEGVTGEKLDIVEWTALLHDIGIKISEQKYNSSAGNYQELEGPPVARTILKEFDISDKLIDETCYIIGNHHSYKKIDSKEFQIIVEADFLVNIYEDDLSTEQVQLIEEKYFKTESGKFLITNMYIKL